MNAREQAEKIVGDPYWTEGNRYRFHRLEELIAAELQKAEARGMRMAAEIVANAPGNTYDVDCEHEQLAASIRAKADELESK